MPGLRYEDGTRVDRWRPGGVVRQQGRQRTAEYLSQNAADVVRRLAVQVDLPATMCVAIDVPSEALHHGRQRRYERKNYRTRGEFFGIAPLRL